MRLLHGKTTAMSGKTIAPSTTGLGFQYLSTGVLMANFEVPYIT
jgi:hypothetical protein